MARSLPLIAVARGAAALLFVVAGLMHFIRPGAYEAVVPKALPAPAVIVAVSGVAEILGGAGLLVPRARRAAGWGLIALLVAVFPANINMALNPETAGSGIPEWALWARLPLQAAMILWVWAVALAPEKDSGTTNR